MVGRNFHGWLRRLCGWLDQVGINLSQLSTKLKLKLKLSLAICVVKKYLGNKIGVQKRCEKKWFRNNILVKIIVLEMLVPTNFGYNKRLHQKMVG